MDPQANVLRTLDLAREIIKVGDVDEYPTERAALYTLRLQEGRAVELAELVQALDGWMRAGGFLPARWARRPEVSP